MKKLLILAAIVACGWLFWSTNYGPSSQWGTTKRFLTAVGTQRASEALALADRDAKSGIEKLSSSAGWVPVEAYHGQTFAKKSSESLPSGDVKLLVSEVLFFDPPGATSAIGGAMMASFDDTVVLSKKSGSWKVVSFDRVFLKADSTRH